MTDLVRRAQAGDQAAFEGVYRDHAARVYALCLRLTGSVSEAEERTQDVFVLAWRRLATFRGESAFATWLHRLTVNLVLTERRTARRREARVLPMEDPASLEHHDGSARPGERLDLERAIAALPTGAREVFVLFDIEGFTHEEIGRRCGIAVGTSKAQLFRARRLLRERLER
ncbi:MAG TPA: sigma-70 family RNA polymerase sigma factor [Gemmatimonadales bacterium]|nr:sigma-70 family RNA polymerase sigma factor [Gemmatimonadales bacterium]